MRPYKEDAVRSGLVLVAASFLLVAGCSGRSNDPDQDGGKSPDAVQIGDTGLPPGYVLWPCDSPGKACNPHDPCAINPICGPDRKCRPSKLQNCDDGLTCTKDVCKGMGLCSFEPVADTCALLVKTGGGADGGVPTTASRCFKKKDKNPSDTCQECDPDTSQTKWTGANGGYCDDGNQCTKDDYCQNGLCKGVSYLSQCDDGYGCTKDLCDGKGGCLGSSLTAGFCLINGTCYKDGTNHPGGTCNTCDTTKSVSAWTPISNTCMIGGKCYKPNDKDTTNCGICDPTKSLTAWTPLPGLCKIGNACYASAAKHPGGCAECDPATSATSWTVKATTHCLINNTCYASGGKDSTGCASCVPTTSKYAFTALPGLCKINNKCYASGAKHTGGCADCQPAVSSTAWTVVGSFCLIGNVCKKPNDKDSTGCGQCTPATSKTGWTPVSNTCLIGSKCYQDKQKDTTGCLMCDVLKDTKAWTPVSGAKVLTYDFEKGTSTGWTLSSQVLNVGWQVSSVRSSSGTYALYYGDTTKKTYDNGSTNSGTATMPGVTLTTGKKAGLRFMLYIDTESGDYYDTLEVHVGSTKVWSKDYYTTMKSWFEVSIDLSAYAGQTVKISYIFDTVDSVSNSTEGVHIDDITIYYDC